MLITHATNEVSVKSDLKMIAGIKLFDYCEHPNTISAYEYTQG